MVDRRLLSFFYLLYADTELRRSTRVDLELIVGVLTSVVCISSCIPLLGCNDSAALARPRTLAKLSLLNDELAALAFCSKHLSNAMRMRFYRQ